MYRTEFLLFCLLMIAAVNAMAAPALQQSEVLFNQKQFAQARTQFLQLASADHQTTTAALARFRAAQCLFEMKEYSALGAEIETIQCEHPPTDFYQRNGLEYYLARIPYEEGKNQIATEALALVARRHPTSVWGAKAGFLQSSALRRLKKFDETRQAFLSIAKANRKPEWTLEARHRAAHCLFDMGDAEAFSREEQMLFDENPPMNNKWVQMTIFLRCHIPALHGQPDEAAAAIQEFMISNPDFHWFDLARHRCGRYYMDASYRAAKAGAPDRALFYKARARDQLFALCDRLKKQIASDPAKNNDYRIRFMIPENYYYARDYASVLTEARKLSSEFPKPTKLWAAGKIWEGIALAQNPADYAAATAVFDELMVSGIHDEDPVAHLPTKAAYWRAFIGRLQHDRAGFDNAVMHLFQMPEGLAKTNALKALKIN